MFALCCRECFVKHKADVLKFNMPEEAPSKHPGRITDSEYCLSIPEYTIMVDDSERYCKCNQKGHLRAGHHCWVAGYTEDWEVPYDVTENENSAR